VHIIIVPKIKITIITKVEFLIPVVILATDDSATTSKGGVGGSIDITIGVAIGIGIGIVVGAVIRNGITSGISGAFLNAVKKPISFEYNKFKAAIFLLLDY